jgi:putative tricarboxylic transport membrane protein
MQSTVARSKELWSGLLFLAIGCVAFGMALQYPIGTMSRMGPGYFPLVLSVTIAALGLIFITRALALGGTPLGGSKPLAIVCVLGSAAIFAVLLDAFGLAISAFLLVVAAYAGGSEFRLARVIALGIGLAAFVVVLFALLLKLQVPIGPKPWS